MKTLLIATTALISVASIAAAAPLPTRETASSLYQVDANQEFLCNYGFQIYTEAYWEDSSETSIGYHWVRAAVPMLGKGKTVDEILVENAPSSTPQGFSVAIYAGVKRPNRLVVGAQVGAPTKCGRVKVPVTPTQLEKGKKYWVVETAIRPRLGEDSSSAKNATTWLYDERRTQGALWQSGYSCYGIVCCRDHLHSCYKHHKTPWESLTGVVPYAKVR